MYCMFACASSSTNVYLFVAPNHESSRFGDVYAWVLTHALYRSGFLRENLRNDDHDIMNQIVAATNQGRNLPASTVLELRCVAMGTHVYVRSSV